MVCYAISNNRTVADLGELLLETHIILEKQLF